jgi:hypothetical protein
MYTEEGMRWRRYAAALGLIASAAQADVSQEAGEWFPKQAGWRWVYRIGDEEVTYSVTGREARGIVLERSQYLAWGRAVEILSVDHSGIRSVERRYGSNKVEFSPAWPYASRRAWEGKVDCRFEKVYGTISYDVRISGRYETITVPAGTFRCWRSDTSMTSNEGKSYSSVYWLSPGRGIVKFAFESDAQANWTYELTRVLRP